MAIYFCSHLAIGRTTHAAGTAGAHSRYVTEAARTWLDGQEAADRKNARVIDKMPAAGTRPRRRLAACLVSLLLAPVGPAFADEVLVPRVGTVITVKITSTNNVASPQPTIIEQTLKRTVIASDGIVYTTDNSILEFKSSNPDIKNNNEYITLNNTTYRYFLFASSRVVGKEPGTGAPAEYANKTDCDKAKFQSFFPVGRLPEVTFFCGTSASRLNAADRPATQIQLFMSYEGRSRIETAAGKVSVQNIRVLTRNSDDSESETLYLLDDRTGIVMHSETENRNKDHKLISTARVDVVKIDATKAVD